MQFKEKKKNIYIYIFTHFFTSKKLSKKKNKKGNLRSVYIYIYDNDVSFFFSLSL